MAKPKTDAAAPAPSAKPASAAPAPAEHGHAKAHVEAPSKGSKGHNPLPGGCFSYGCKAQATRFNFCTEHYEHFKFGLIKKTGEPVSDYEKKFEHFQAYRARAGQQVLRKAA